MEPRSFSRSVNERGAPIPHPLACLEPHVASMIRPFVRVEFSVPRKRDIRLPSFGEKLKLEREKRKMTLEEISSSTKISTRMLHALEEDKFSQLPGGIFNKGFVRAYARTVGLDEDQAVADYLEASGEAPPVRAEPASRDSAPRAVPLRITDDNSGRLEIRAEAASRQLPWGVFAVVLLIIALALSLWSHRRREQERLAAHPPRSAPHEQLLPADENAPHAATGSAPEASPVSQQTNSTSLRSASDLSLEKSAATPPRSSVSAASTPLAPGEFAVTVRAREETWLSISIDGKHTGSEVLEPGDERTLPARNDVVIKAGNSGGIDLQLNGKKLPFSGELGEVKTITIGPSGILPTAPASPQP
jgi:cytoskeleton protein RodZ